MLVSDILTRVQRAFGDESNAQIDSNDVLRWVNDAQSEIARQKQLLQVTTTVTVSNGVGNYAVPTNILQMRSVRYDGVVLRNISLQEAEELVPSYDAGAALIGSGTPTHYWIWGGFVYLYPIPSNSTSVLKMYYTRIPVQVTLTSDTPELPVQYHPRIVEYCLAQAYELDSNPAQQNFKMGQFTAGVQATDMDSYVARGVYPSITLSVDDSWFWGY
jgi:uncharacterized protein DUF6682